MVFNPAMLEQLASKWQSGAQMDVLSYLNDHFSLPEILQRDLLEAYNWVDFLLKVYITCKDFSQAEIVAKMLFKHKDFEKLSESLKANLYISLGVSFGFRGAFQKAIEYYTLALKIGEKLHDYSIIARSCNNLGLNYMYLDRFNEAEGILLHGIECAMCINAIDERNTRELVLRGNLSELYRKEHRYKKSMFEAHKVMHLLKEKNKFDQDKLIEIKAETLEILILLHIELKSNSEVTSYLTLLRNINFTPNAQFGVFHYLRAHAYYYWLVEGKLLAAETLFRQALILAKRLEAGEFVFRTQVSLAQLLVDRAFSLEGKNVEQAREILAQLDPILTDVINFSKTQQLHGVMAQTYLIRSEYKRCLKELDLAYQNLTLAYSIMVNYHLEHLTDQFEKIEKRLNQQREQLQENTEEKSLTVKLEDFLEYLADMQYLAKPFHSSQEWNAPKETKHLLV